MKSRKKYFGKIPRAFTAFLHEFAGRAIRGWEKSLGVMV
jgi:hypothetical protein